MEDLRQYHKMPEFEYKGRMLSALLYKKGNSDLIHSFDIVTNGYNISKLDPRSRFAIFGFDARDMEKLRIRVQSYIDFKEGRMP